MESITQFFTFLLQPYNAPFFWSIVIMLIMGGLEIGSLVIGASLIQALDDLLPDIDIDVDVDVDVDVDADVEAGDADIGGAGQPNIILLGLNWISIGKMPYLVWLILFLTLFGISGFIFQGINYNLLKGIIPTGGIIAGDVILTFIILHFIGNAFSKIMPQIETTAVALESLVGKIGVITVGTASVGNPAEAKVEDDKGYDHYVRVVPANEEDTIGQNEKIVLIEYKDSIFIAEKFNLD